MKVEAVKLALLKVSRSGHYSLVRQEDPTAKGFANSILRLLGYSFARSKPSIFTNIDLNRSVLLPFKERLARSLIHDEQARATIEDYPNVYSPNRAQTPRSELKSEFTI